MEQTLFALLDLVKETSGSTKSRQEEECEGGGKHQGWAILLIKTKKQEAEVEEKCQNVTLMKFLLQIKTNLFTLINLKSCFYVFFFKFLWSGVVFCSYERSVSYLQQIAVKAFPVWRIGEDFTRIIKFKKKLHKMKAFHNKSLNPPAALGSKQMLFWPEGSSCLGYLTKFGFIPYDVWSSVFAKAN